MKKPFRFDVKGRELFPEERRAVAAFIRKYRAIIAAEKKWVAEQSKKDGSMK